MEHHTTKLFASSSTALVPGLPALRAHVRALNDGYRGTSADVIFALKRAGWEHVRTNGSHHHFHHPRRPNLVTVPHPRKDLSIAMLRKLLAACGVRLR